MVSYYFFLMKKPRSPLFVRLVKILQVVNQLDQ